MRIHSFLTAKCIAKPSLLDANGIFAKEPIKKGELIAVWGGLIYTAKEVGNLAIKNPHFSTHTVSVYENFYMGPLSENVDVVDDSELFNHSCEPNIGVRGQIILVARRDIKKGEELFFDYETTETSNEGWFYCKCGAKKCRKKIDGSAWKDPSFIRHNKEYLSEYIKMKISKRKR